MQQRRTVNNSQYQQVPEVAMEQGGNQLAIQPLYRPTFVEDTLSRSNYMRIIDLVNLFGDVLKVGKDTFPAGDFGKVVTGLFKFITEVVLPIWKAVQEMVNQGKISNLIILAHVLNVFDALLSTVSAGFWLGGTTNNSETAYSVEKYLLAAAMCLHLLKDAVQPYEKRKTDEHDSKLKEQRLINFERAVTNHGQWIEHHKNEFTSVGTNIHSLFQQVNSVQQEQARMQRSLQGLESRVQESPTLTPWK